MKIKLLFLVFSVYGCMGIKNHRGYIYYNKKPLPNVLIEQLTNDEIVRTDSLGYFQFKNSKRSRPFFVFSKKNYKTDTVSLVRFRPMKQVFLRKQLDTLFMNK